MAAGRRAGGAPTGVRGALDDPEHVVELSAGLDVVDLDRGVDAASQPVGDATQPSHEAAAAAGLHLRPADAPGPKTETKWCRAI